MSKIENCMEMLKKYGIETVEDLEKAFNGLPKLNISMFTKGETNE